MPLARILMKPGIRSIETPTLNQGGFSEAQNIRFFNGYPQTDNGFVELVDLGAAAGPVRALSAWAALSGVKYLGIGAARRLFVFTGGVATDVTPETFVLDSDPLQASTTANSETVQIDYSGGFVPSIGDWFILTAPFSVGGIVVDVGAYAVSFVGANLFQFQARRRALTTESLAGVTREFQTAIGDATVAVQFPDHGLIDGDAIYVAEPVSVGGVTISGGYEVSVVDGDSFTIEAATAATTVASAFEAQGRFRAIFPDGAPGAVQDIPAAEVSLANWGEFLLHNPRGGSVYEWMPANGVGTRAQLVIGAPRACNLIIVSSQSQQLVCFGTVSITGDFDPMLIRWSDVADYGEFVPDPANQAGSYRLTIGSRIVSALAVDLQNYVWTDLVTYSMQYVGPPFIYGFQPMGINCGAVSRNCIGVMSDTIFWCSQNQFYRLVGGAMQPLDCPIWDQVFPNMDRGKLNLVTCETDSYYNEVGWSVPQSGGATVRVRLCLRDGSWTAQTYHHHTAWIDQSVFGAPISGHESGLIDQHNVGYAAFGEALPVRLKTGMILIAEGLHALAVQQIIPDFKFGADGQGDGEVRITGYFYDDPNTPPRVHGPLTLTAATRGVTMRGRARQVQFEIESDMTTMWRMGDLRYRAIPDGRK